jgi:rubrerythrin
VHEKAEPRKVANIVTSIFKSIATEETEIERYRQELAQMNNFDSKILYDKINADGNDHISDAELLEFI